MIHVQTQCGWDCCKQKVGQLHIDRINFRLWSARFTHISTRTAANTFVIVTNTIKQKAHTRSITLSPTAIDG